MISVRSTYARANSLRTSMVVMLSAILVGTLPKSSTAYEIGTHGRITNAAYFSSALGTPSSRLFKELGFRRLPQATELGREYYDIAGGEQQIRTFFDIYEGTYAGLRASPGALNWFIAGAVREDDIRGESKIPQDDPYPDVPIRVFNHFFDPINNRPLTIAGTSIFLKSPDWAFGTSDVFTSPNILDNSRRNHFTLADAREALYRALTLQKRDRSSGQYSEVQIFQTAENRQIERNRYWSTTFRSLGDVVHLLQDTGQPQHTRNEPHSGKFDEGTEALVTGHDSVIESYLEARAKADGISKFTIDGAELVPTDLKITPGPIPEFDSYLKFWTTSQADPITERRGLADFSNREFLTNGHIQAPAYSLPSIAQLSLCEEQPFTLGYQLRLGAVISPLKQLCGTLHDRYSRTETADVPLISRGLLYRFAPLPIMDATYVLTKPNIDAMADHLLPRAAGYSAGLLNRFFRGRLQISVPENKVYAVVDSAGLSGSDKNTGGFRKLRAMVKNVTPPVNENGQSSPQDMQGGRLVAIIQYNENNCYQQDLSGEYGPENPAASCRNRIQEIATSVTTRTADGTPVETVSLPAGGEPQLFEFDFTTDIIPITATDIYLQLVYRGKLGTEEDAVVVGTKDISEVNYRQVHNATDYLICVSNTWYRRNADGSLGDAARNAIIAADGDPDDAYFVPKPIARTTFSLQTPFVPFGAPLVERIDLQPRRYIRYAFLTDAADATISTYASLVSMDNLQFDVNTRPIATYQITYDDNGEAVNDFFTRTNTFRGVRGTYFTFAALGWPNDSVCDLNAIDDSNPVVPGLVPLSSIYDGATVAP